MGIIALRLFRWVFRLARNHGWRMIEPLHHRLAPDMPIIAQVEGHAMLLDLHEGYNWRLFKWGMTFAEEFGPFCNIIRPGMTVIDIGANVGVFTLAAARLVGSDGRVVAFEPLARNYRFVMANLALNGYENVVVEQMAVTNQDGTLEMHVFGTDNLSVSNLVTGSSDWQIGEVACCRLDTYLRQTGIQQVDLIKIDVEGAEALVLEGMKGFMSQAGFPALVIEVHPDFLETVDSSAHSVMAKLGELGYELTYLRRDGATRIEDPVAFEYPYDTHRHPLNVFRILAFQSEH